MRLPLVFVFSFIFFIAGCAEDTQFSSDPASQATGMADPAATREVWRNEAFVEHMHLHAEKLDDLNFALADEDLDAAKDAANWLATHDTDSNIRSEWMPHLYRMRSEAEAVAAAPDVAAAQAAALRITIQCQECHAAVGINAELSP